MSIPFEEFEQSNSRIGLITACTVDALVSYLPKFKLQKHKTPGFFRNQGFCPMAHPHKKDYWRLVLSIVTLSGNSKCVKSPSIGMSPVLGVPFLPRPKGRTKAMVFGQTSPSPHANLCGDHRSAPCLLSFASPTQEQVHRVLD